MATGIREIAFAILAICLAFAWSPAHAADTGLSPRQLEIMQTALAPDGFVSPQLHAEFWSLAPPEVRRDPKIRDAFVALVDRTLVSGVRFQRESWASMKASIAARRVVKTPGYEDAKRAVLSASSLPQYVGQARTGVANAEGMIKAAADGAPFQTPRGTIYITPEMVDQVLNGLEGSVARFRILTTPEWAPQVRENRYPEAHVAILSAVPFAVERKTITVENGRSGNTVMLNNTVSETEFVGVHYTHHGAVFADPKGAVIRIAKGGIAGAGAHPISAIMGDTWRGLNSAKGSGKADTSEGTVFVSVRAVELRKYLGSLSLVAVSTKSKVDADMLLENLERSLQIID